MEIGASCVFEIDTPATGYSEVLVRFAVIVVDASNWEFELTGIDEVEVDGVLLSWRELNALGYRTLAHEIATMVDDRMHWDTDLIDEMLHEAEEAAADWAFEQRSDHY